MPRAAYSGQRLLRFATAVSPPALRDGRHPYRSNPADPRGVRWELSPPTGSCRTARVGRFRQRPARPRRICLAGSQSESHRCGHVLSSRRDSVRDLAADLVKRRFVAAAPDHLTVKEHPPEGERNSGTRCHQEELEGRDVRRQRAGGRAIGVSSSSKEHCVQSIGLRSRWPSPGSASVGGSTGRPC